jgi:predicted DNA-binding protein
MKALKKKPIQIYIEPRQDNVLEDLSKKRGISKAAIIRESVEKYLKELPVEEDAAIGIIGLGRSGKGDLSGKHDRYLARYSASRKK